jgi:hypothetical protein
VSARVSRRRLLRMLGVGVAGGVLGGGVVGAVISKHPTTWQLETVPTAALPQVETTLIPEDRARLIDEARRCREPLAQVFIWHSPATRGGTVSLISGSYHSPSFPLKTVPSMVAIPFPAPYASGRGQLTVVGEASDFGMALSPQYVMAHIEGAVLIRVRWAPVEGCP